MSIILQKYRNAEISTKITATYTACFLLLLMIINVVMYFGVYYALYRPASRSIKFSMANVHHLMDTIAQDTKSFQPGSIHEPLVAGVVLRAIDDDGNILIDSDAHYLSNSDFEENILSDPPIFANDDMDVAVYNGALVYRAKSESAIADQHFTLYFFRTITSEKALLDRLENLLLVLDLFGIFFAVAVGNLTSRKVLKPIKTMTEHAKNIAFGKMDGRIEIPPANDELTELAKTFNEMLDRLQGGINRQQQFISKQQKFVSDASHELRNPAQVIISYTDIMIRYGAEDKETFDECIEAIRSESANMKNLLDNLLFLARNDQNRQPFKMQLLNLDEILFDVMKKTMTVDKAHKVELVQNDFAQIRGDETTMMQMIRIFLDNAAKYTPAGGTISVKSVKAGGEIRLSISDSGIGIAPENLDKIFERFYHVDEKKGTGLGLSIAKCIAEKHGIKIEVASELGAGTTFTLIIPAA